MKTVNYSKKIIKNSLYGLYGTDGTVIYDRVICIDTGGVTTLTKGKVYDGQIFSNDYIGVTDDINDHRNFKSKRFMLLSEYRLNKMEELGI